MPQLTRILSSRRRSIVNPRNALLFLVATLFLNHFRPRLRSILGVEKNKSAPQGVHSSSEDGELLCRKLPGADETVIIIKTGVTEFSHKFPVHVDTTLKCYPNYLVFSDHHEMFRGEIDVIDALEPISHDMKYNEPDFEYYLRVRDGGRTALQNDELSNKAGFNRHPTDADKMGMGGWRLDKWKFLPMYNTTYHMYPDMKWYVFVEADTYMFWSNMLKYLAAMDHTKPYYIGADLFIDWTLFAHGGAGVVISKAAMELYVDEYQARSEDWEMLVQRHWAGDIVLGRALNAAGVHLTPAWPHFHPHAPGNDTYYWADDDRRFWCYPVLSYHHVTPEVVADLWQFEQEWIEREYQSASQGGSNKMIHDSPQLAMKRRDIFMNYIHEKMKNTHFQWDNNCIDEHGVVPSRDTCLSICERREECLQWRYDSTTSKCWTNNEARWGDAAPNTGYVSGWMHDRVKTWIDEQVPCGQEGWITE